MQFLEWLQILREYDVYTQKQLFFFDKIIGDHFLLSNYLDPGKQKNNYSFTHTRLLKFFREIKIKIVCSI